jgi:hypothetical protein
MGQETADGSSEWHGGMANVQNKKYAYERPNFNVMEFLKNGSSNFTWVGVFEIRFT